MYTTTLNKSDLNAQNSGHGHTRQLQQNSHNVNKKTFCYFFKKKGNDVYFSWTRHSAIVAERVRTFYGFWSRAMQLCVHRHTVTLRQLITSLPLPFPILTRYPRVPHQLTRYRHEQTQRIGIVGNRILSQAVLRPAIPKRDMCATLGPPQQSRTANVRVAEHFHIFFLFFHFFGFLFISFYFANFLTKWILLSSENIHLLA